MAIHTDYVSNGIAPVLRPLSPENRTKMAIDSVSNEGVTEVKTNEWIWDNRLIWDEDNYPAPEPLLMRGDEEYIHRGDIQMIQGQSKCGKSILFSAMMAAALGGKPYDCLGFGTCFDNMVVMYVDTEQNIRNTAEIRRRAKKWSQLPDEQSKRLYVASQKGMNVEERKAMLREAFKRFKPDICFLDGVKDLCHDFNNLAESTELIDELMSYAVDYNCAIINIIHENFGTEKARGHLGSLLEQKCTIVIQVKVEESADGKFRRVHTPRARNTKEPEDFTFIIDDNGLPRLTTPPVKSAKSDDVRKFLQDVMKPDEIVFAGELRKRLMDKTGCKERAASGMLDAGTREGILSHYGSRRDSRYQLKPKTLTDETKEYDNDIPF